MLAEPKYGSHSGDDKESEQFDLVRDIKLVITYKVGDATEKLEFNVAVTRVHVEIPFSVPNNVAPGIVTPEEELEVGIASEGAPIYIFRLS